MDLINAILAAIVGLIVVLFAVSNRAAATVEIWPLPYQLSLPLYALILLAVLIGFFAGLAAAWLIGGARRREHRRLRKQLRTMERSLSEHRVTGTRDFS